MAGTHHGGAGARDAADQHNLRVIAEHGWMVQSVFPARGGNGAPFAYTVGLTAAGLPELIVCGLPADIAGHLLNTAAHRSLGAELRPGEALDEIASVPLRVVDAPTAPVTTAHRLYPDRTVRALQLVWPDLHGHYPGDDRWSLGDAQPVHA
ncbi:DUF4262 domain-containing protein [Asanoa siamensis]|uniref:DUF4262 domain-containing protein n=1 Tax=Asanoa siamensis TaxID=926357 RepID=A0ABQ4CWJ9_9ACTN|nr:DUF4262 domain-containing protein [Asanoa siamensis]GIF75669.1 hypothetical protein Asi02nite_51870 [Asanoa siamensis]